jgi:peptidoglycan/LPS O-acetylase OafA/YrhL
MLSTLKKLPHKVLMILTKPERFFKKIVADGNFEEAMIKAFLFGLIGGVAILAINLIGGNTVTFTTVFVKLVMYPMIAVGVLFMFAGLMMMFAEITGGNRDWEIAIKGIASIFFMYPLILILDSLAFNCMSLWIINILVDGYVTFLLYNIALHCMKGKKGAVLSIIAVAIVFLIMIYMSNYNIGWLALKNPSIAIECLAY